jgi:hypothetical protein
MSLSKVVCGGGPLVGEWVGCGEHAVRRRPEASPAVTGPQEGMMMSKAIGYSSMMGEISLAGIRGAGGTVACIPTSRPMSSIRPSAS